MHSPYSSSSIAPRHLTRILSVLAHLPAYVSRRMAPDEDVSIEKIWFAVFVSGNVAILSFARTLRPWDQLMRGQSSTVKGLWRSILSVLLLSPFLVFGISYH